jgi:cellulose synthase/poly-beta-1,6-N-acetylglucosamine synthase-like glycosyltransferase
VARSPIEPTVSVLIPAYNEADVIAATLTAMLAQDYPKDRLQILVVSDCSDDGTDDIVRSFADRGVELLRQPSAAARRSASMPRCGGPAARSSSSATRTRASPPGAVRSLAQNFADPSWATSRAH